MEVYLFYTRQTESERRMERLLEQLKDRRVDAEMVDSDSIHGARLAEIYDLMARPSIIVVTGDGQMVQAWTDPEQIPTADEVSYYAHL